MPTAGNAQSGNKGTMAIVVSGSPRDIETGKWTFAAETDQNVYNSSRTGGHKKADAGNDNATGTVEGNRYTDDPIEGILKNGDKVHLKLYFDSGAGIDIPSALVSNLSFDVDQNSGALESFAFNYTTDGEYTYF